MPCLWGVESQALCMPNKHCSNRAKPPDLQLFVRYVLWILYYGISQAEDKGRLQEEMNRINAAQCLHACISKHQCEQATPHLPWNRGSEGWGTWPPGRPAVLSSEKCVSNQGRQSRMKLDLGQPCPGPWSPVCAGDLVWTCIGPGRTVNRVRSGWWREETPVVVAAAMAAGHLIVTDYSSVNI